jgi:hypothetical protein
VNIEMETHMRSRQFLFILFFAVASALSARGERIPLPIDQTTLSCSPGALEVLAPVVGPFVKGSYPGHRFQAARFDNACFFSHYLVDYAERHGGVIDAALDVRVDTVKEPILKCKKVCAFCDPECQVVGEKTYDVEKVYLDVLGIRFFGQSRLAK